MSSNVLWQDGGGMQAPTGAPPAPGDDFGFMSGGYNQGASGEFTAAQLAPPETDEDYANEPPLLEELGIDFGHILHKVSLVLNQAKPVEETVLNDTDLAGPLVFCAALGFFSLLAGKVNFGYIYGFALTGCLALYAVLNLMTGHANGLSGVRVLVDLRGMVGLVLGIVVILWSTLAATRIFSTYLRMQDQRYLIAYPILLLYACFALIVTF